MTCAPSCVHEFFRSLQLSDTELEPKSAKPLFSSPMYMQSLPSFRIYPPIMLPPSTHSHSNRREIYLPHQVFFPSTWRTIMYMAPIIYQHTIPIIPPFPLFLLFKLMERQRTTESSSKDDVVWQHHVPSPSLPTIIISLVLYIFNRGVVECVWRRTMFHCLTCCFPLSWKSFW